MNLTSMTDAQIRIWINNHETNGGTRAPLYFQLLEDRARRDQEKQKLRFDRSLDHLMQAAIGQRCTSYGALAEASDVKWSAARHQMNGANGHLDRLIDICHARGLPLLTAICVNKDQITSGELGNDALEGFVAAARRIGLLVDDPKGFHLKTCMECWAWGLKQDA